jgi:hypothetical protein
MKYQSSTLLLANAFAESSPILKHYRHTLAQQNYLQSRNDLSLLPWHVSQI